MAYTQCSVSVPGDLHPKWDIRGIGSCGESSSGDEHTPWNCNVYVILNLLGRVVSRGMLSYRYLQHEVKKNVNFRSPKGHAEVSSFGSPFSNSSLSRAFGALRMVIMSLEFFE